MTKFKIVAAAAAVGILLQTQAFAGLYSAVPVTVSSISGYGSVQAARGSGDSRQYISCYIGGYVSNADITNTSTINYLSCSAVDSTGKAYYCYTSNPPATWINMAAAINSLSYIYFYGDAAGHCQGLNITQGSQYL